MRFFARLAAILTICALSGFGQSTPLSLDDCIRLAQSAQSAVSIARQQVLIARYGTTQARANFFPQAAIGTSFLYNSPLRNRSEFSFVALNGVREYSTLGSIGIELDTSGRLRAQLARAHADQDAAAANMTLAQRDLKRAVTAAYYQVLLARRLVEATRESLAESQNFEKRARLLFQNGEAAEADVVKASAEVSLLQQSLNTAELQAKMANHDLASFWTEDVDTTLSLESVLGQPAPKPETVPAGEPYLGRIEFRLLDAEHRGFLADARRARSDLFPQLSVVVQYGIDSNRFSFADRGYASFIHLNVPVFDWFRSISASRQSRMQAQQVDTSNHIARRTFSRDYQDALSRVRMIYDQIGLAESQVKLSEENLRLSRVRYEGGEGLALDVVVAQSQLAQARANYFTTKANYLNARADLEVAAGR